MLPQQMGPASHRRSRQGGSQNDRSENRRSNGVCVVPAEDVRPGGHGPAGISVAWHPTIHAARCRGPGEACSRLQAAKGSCHEAHAAAGPQHRARASATRLETADRVGRHPLRFPSSLSLDSDFLQVAPGEHALRPGRGDVVLVATSSNCTRSIPSCPTWERRRSRSSSMPCGATCSIAQS